jgi:hypothetical protein
MRRRFVSQRGPDGRLVLLTLLSAYLGAVALAAHQGFDLWRLLGVPTASPTFLDTRVIVSGWECTRRGLDVLVENPCDPWDRPMNYPRIWTAPARLGLEEGDTVVLALATCALFFLAVFLVIGRLRPREVFIYGAVLMSPAVMFGVERGNNDLLVFALVAAAVYTLRGGAAIIRALSWGLFLLAAVLKLYPVFAFVALLRLGRRRAGVALGVTLLPLAVYLASIRDDLRSISEATPRPVSLAYGAGVFLDGASERLAGRIPGVEGLMDAPGRTIAYAFSLLVAVALSAWLARHVGPTFVDESDAASQRRLDAFWAGAGVYLGTFALGHNWDYRLLFLLLTVPQTLRWAQSPRALGTVSRWALVALVGTVWLSLFLPRLSISIPLDELLNWFLFVYLGAGLLVTAPAWLPGSARGIWIQSEAPGA